MAKTKISKIAKDLNVSLQTVYDFLNKKNISVDESPNTRVEDDIVVMLTNEFGKDGAIKKKTEPAAERRAKTEPETKPAEEPAAAPGVAKTPSDLAQKPKFIGRIELDKNGNPIKPAEKPAPEAPKPAPEPEPAKAA